MTISFYLCYMQHIAGYDQYILYSQWSGNKFLFTKASLAISISVQIMLMNMRQYSSGLKIKNIAISINYVALLYFKNQIQFIKIRLPLENMPLQICIYSQYSDFYTSKQIYIYAVEFLCSIRSFPLFQFFLFKVIATFNSTNTLYKGVLNCQMHCSLFSLFLFIHTLCIHIIITAKPVEVSLRKVNILGQY